MTVRAHAALSCLLDDDRTAALVRAYFDPETPFAGYTFDDLGENPSEEITPSDLLAVSLLDVAIPAPSVRALIENPARWSELLRQERIPDDVPLWEMTDQHYDAANQMWRALNELSGVGPTKAGKLMARKRPHLIPIFDEVVGGFLKPWTDDLWKDLRTALSDVELRSRIDSLADRLPRRPSTLRLVDVAIWMRNSGSRNARSARETAGVPFQPLYVD